MVSHETLEASLRWVGFPRFQLTLNFSQLAVDAENVRVELGQSALDIEGRYTFPFGLALTKINRLNLRQGTILIYPMAEGRANEESTPNLQSLEQISRYLPSQLEELNVEKLGLYQMYEGKRSPLAEIVETISCRNNLCRGKIVTQLIRDKKETHDFSLVENKLVIDSYYEKQFLHKTRLALSINKGQLHARLNLLGDNTQLEASFESVDNTKISGIVSGQWNNKKLRVDLQDTSFLVTLNEERFEVTKSTIFFQKTSAQRHPVAALVNITASISWASPFEVNVRYVFQKPQSPSAIRISGSGGLSTKSLEVQPRYFAVEPDSLIEIDDLDFAEVTDALKDTNFAVPAPLNVLEGPVKIKISPSTEKELQIKVESTVDLTSQKQQLKFESSSTLTFQTQTQLKPESIQSTVSINRLGLLLPDFSVTSAPPPITPDSRFGRKPQSEQTKTLGPSWSVRVKSQPKSNLALLNTPFADSLPFSIALFLSSEGREKGTIKILPCSVQLFRRKGFVDYFEAKIDGTPEKTILALDGVIRVSYIDYEIRISIRGNSESPQISIESTPPLSRQEALALLLFGIVPETPLSQTQSSTVSSVDTALTKRSLGLATMYVFASTPIQSVTYDPSTEQLEVRFKLGERMVVHYSKGIDDNSAIGLSRRIGQHWKISSQFNLGEQQAPVSTFLEWFNQY